MCIPTTHSQNRLTRRGLPARFHHIANALREDIWSGRFTPGEALPCRLKLVRRFNCATHTVQRAISLLKSEGLLTSSSLGTFVADVPESTLPYVLVLPWTHMPRHFLVSLASEAARLNRNNIPFQIITMDTAGIHGEPFHTLAGIVRSHHLAGMILVMPDHLFMHSSVMNEPHIPSVWIESLSAPPENRISLCGDFLSEALRACTARGRRRIALIHAVQFDAEIEPAYARYVNMLEKHNLEARPHWWIPVHLETPESATHATAALVSLPRDLQPDALIIDDDNLVPAATRGIAAGESCSLSGILDVVGHANFPHPTPAAVPTLRLGFNVRLLLKQACDGINRLRRGDRLVEQTVCLQWENDD